MKRSGRASSSPPSSGAQVAQQAAPLAVGDPLAEVVQPRGVPRPLAAAVAHPLHLAPEALPGRRAAAAGRRAPPPGRPPPATRSRSGSARASAARARRAAAGAQVRLQRERLVRRAGRQLAHARRAAAKRDRGPGRSLGAERGGPIDQPCLVRIHRGARGQGLGPGAGRGLLPAGGEGRAQCQGRGGQRGIPEKIPAAQRRVVKRALWFS